MLKVHILTDNQVRRRGLLAEHGLSLWIEKDDRRILFDTGQSAVFQHNAQVMGIDLKGADYIVLSHGHYDHGGGLLFFPETKQKPAVYAHPDIFLKKFAVTDRHEPVREVGIPLAVSSLGWLKERMVYTRQPLAIEKGVLISGEIPSSSDFEKASEGFCLKKDGRMLPDQMLDEQMLVIEDEGELAIFLGCSHPGIINCLLYAQKLFPQRRIKLLVAGMHLTNVTSASLHLCIQHLLAMPIRTVVPLHCTGFRAQCEIKNALGDHCLIRATGDTIEI